MKVITLLAEILLLLLLAIIELIVKQFNSEFSIEIKGMD